MRLIVSGAREGFDATRLNSVLDGYREQYGDALVVIEGCAPGVDTQAAEWADRNRIPVWHQPAPWTHLPRWKAGPWRNRAMLKVAMTLGEEDIVQLVCFHDDIEGRSRGTRDMRDAALAEGIPVHVVQTP